MMSNNDSSGPKDFAGSRLRCLMLTSVGRTHTARVLDALAQPWGSVTADDVWLPRGFLQPKEADLAGLSEVLPTERCKELSKWWLQNPTPMVPHWDIASTCTIGQTKGLLLVEAKAHVRELGEQDCTGAIGANRASIEQAVTEASNQLGDGFSLRIDDHYQISNRFAWAWKIASLGIPVALVYLGFLNADEMTEGRRMCAPLRSKEEWEQAVLEYASGIVPKGAWGSKMPTTDGAPLYPLIHALDLIWQ